jgi:hypothetical protein
MTQKLNVKKLLAEKVRKHIPHVEKIFIYVDPAPNGRRVKFDAVYGRGIAPLKQTPLLDKLEAAAREFVEESGFTNFRFKVTEWEQAVFFFESVDKSSA